MKIYNGYERLARIILCYQMNMNLQWVKDIY